MANIKTLGSGSLGNCYLIECERQTLILDLGLSWDDILAGLNYDIKNVTACLVTHCHKDHSFSIEKALKYQIPVYSCPDVSARTGCVSLKAKQTYKIGEFKIIPLLVPHGGVECYSYIVIHNEIGALLFCTDLTDFRYNAAGLNHILIEANYSEDILVDNLCHNRFVRSHPENHLSIDRCCEILKRLKSPQLNSVMLIHLSSSNSDADDFKAQAREILGWEPMIARPGVQYEIGREEF